LGARTPHALGTLALILGLAGCSFNSIVDSERVDYRSGAAKVNPLEIPPDLAQLNKEGRYAAQPRGSVSASALPTAGMTRTATQSSAKVAPDAIGEIKVERDGDKRWLVVPRPPEQIWSQVASFWQELGFTLVKNDPTTGVMETNWAENRAKLPQDFIRKAIGSVLDSAYSTGEMDQYRTRVERTATGSEIFVRHKGMEEVFTSPQQDNTRWQPRAVDPQLEAEML